MCKYATMIEEPNQIRYALEKAYYLAMTGRKGPSWVDIPVNYQGSIIETEELVGFDPETEENPDTTFPEKIESSLIDQIVEKRKKTKRPGL